MPGKIMLPGAGRLTNDLHTNRCSALLRFQSFADTADKLLEVSARALGARTTP